MRLWNFNVPITWSDLVRRTVKETMADDGLGLAAQLAYYFFLALFPALLFLLALASFFPVSQLSDLLPQMLGRFAAPEMVQILRTQLEQLSNAGHGGILSIGLLGALWSSSAALVSIIGALNRAYDIEESRPWWKVRLVAVALTIGLAVFVLASLTLVMAGPSLGRLLAERVGLGDAFTWTWMILQWPVAFLFISTAVGLVYYLAPDADQEWVWVTPGALLATALWLLASFGFRLYVVSFADYQASYGALGGVVVLMLWMYLTGLAIVVGAEMNAEIEHASPWGKDPGEKVPGERKKIGSLAERAFREGPRKPGGKAPAPRPERPIAPVPAIQPAIAAQRASVGDWLAAFALRLVWPRLKRDVRS
jgi:membrane protein